MGTGTGVIWVGAGCPEMFAVLVIDGNFLHFLEMGEAQKGGVVLFCLESWKTHYF